jgi:membrane protein YqaA with SNARE-associated domain
MSIKAKVARKAIESTAKHTAHGTASKLRRNPARAATLLGLGAAIGGFTGWLIGRSASPAPS